ncbi:MAG TPA: AAA family ATPase, partial [Aquificae bacterium]|nr:AAA family ATPase [Aquificota bacterium]
MLENIIGHKKNIELLLKLKEKEKLPSNLIFEGFEGIGKKLVAKSLFSFQEVSQKDFFLIGEDSYPKISDVRNLIFSLSKKSIKKYKVAILDNAENITLEAANALLKLFEEPPSNSFIILITTSSNKLTKTLVSRAKIFKFSPLSKKEIKEFAKNQKIDLKKYPELLDFSRGRPGHLLR